MSEHDALKILRQREAESARVGIGKRGLGDLLRLLLRFGVRVCASGEAFRRSRCSAPPSALWAALTGTGLLARPKQVWRGKHIHKFRATHAGTAEPRRVAPAEPAAYLCELTTLLFDGSGAGQVLRDHAASPPRWHPILARPYSRSRRQPWTYAFQKLWERCLSAPKFVWT